MFSSEHNYILVLSLFLFYFITVTFVPSIAQTLSDSGKLVGAFIVELLFQKRVNDHNR